MMLVLDEMDCDIALFPLDMVFVILSINRCMLISFLLLVMIDMDKCTYIQLAA